MAGTTAQQPPELGGQELIRGEPLRPLPTTRQVDAEEAALGRQLFHEPLLSRDGSLSCASCHNLESGGDDGLPRSAGFGGEKRPVNTPTVFNSTLSFRKFWDGRVRTMEEQLDEAIRGEMQSTWDEAVAHLRTAPRYQDSFEAFHDDGLTAANVRAALAAFLHTLLTPGAPFDRYLEGDEEALSPRQKEGYRLFKTYGCTSCHQGVGIGGNMFQTLGLFNDYFGDRGAPTKADLGRFNLTKEPADLHVFRVPSLRNVALTAPYLHDGNVETLEGAVRTMGWYQLGRRLSQEEVGLIADFLRTLTGTYRGQPLSAPAP